MLQLLAVITNPNATTGAISLQCQANLFSFISNAQNAVNNPPCGNPSIIATTAAPPTPGPGVTGG